MSDGVANMPDFDAAGLLHPPWLKYPDLPSGHAGWRIGRARIMAAVATVVEATAARRAASCLGCVFPAP